MASKQDESPRSADERFFTPRVSARSGGYTSSGDEGSGGGGRGFVSSRSWASDQEYRTSREEPSGSDGEFEGFHSTREEQHPEHGGGYSAVEMPFIAADHHPSGHMGGGRGPLPPSSSGYEGKFEDGGGGGMRGSGSGGPGMYPPGGGSHYGHGPPHGHAPGHGHPHAAHYPPPPQQHPYHHHHHHHQQQQQQQYGGGPSGGPQPGHYDHQTARAHEGKFDQGYGGDHGVPGAPPGGYEPGSEYGGQAHGRHPIATASASTGAGGGYVAQQDVADVFSLARHNRADDVSGLLDKGIPVDVRDKFGNTLLCVACQNGLKKMAKLALRRGADINARNHKGNTPLHFCFTYGYGDTLGAYLTSKGADPTIRNNFGLTCYEGLGGSKGGGAP